MSKLKLIFLITFIQLAVFASQDPLFVKSNQPHFVQVINSGTAALNLRINLIRNAKKSIYIETFIYDNDPVSRTFTRELMKKAQQGLDVRVMVDHLAGRINKFFMQQMLRSGIKVKTYNTKSLFSIKKVQYRNHRKLMTIDGKKALMGGRNFSNEYYDLDPEYNFIDRDVYTRGPIVSSIEESFLLYWNDKYASDPKEPTPPKITDSKYQRMFFRNDERTVVRSLNRDIRKFNKKIEKYKLLFENNKEDDKIVHKALSIYKEDILPNLLNESGFCPSVTFVSDKPGVGKKHQKNQRILKHEIFRRMRNAKDEVYIENPYIVLDKETDELFEDLTKNNTKINIVTNSFYATDSILVAANFNQKARHFIEENNIHTYLYSGLDPLDYSKTSAVAGARWGIHAKSFIFDSDSFLIGSYNFDPRSNDLNMELGLFCDGGHHLTSILKSSVNLRIQNSYYLKDNKTFRKLKFKNISVGQKILSYIATIPSLIFNDLL